MADEPDYGEFDDGREDDNDLPEIILPAPASDGAALFQVRNKSDVFQR